MSNWPILFFSDAIIKARTVISNKSNFDLYYGEREGGKKRNENVTCHAMALLLRRSKKIKNKKFTLAT